MTNLLNGGAKMEHVCEITDNTLKSIQKYIVPIVHEVRREIAAGWKAKG